MRELKFRIWDKKRKKFLDSDYIAITPSGDLICRRIHYEFDPYEEESWTEVLDNEKFVVQSYTTVNDVNGKEIYEGDIVNSLNAYEEYYTAAVIVWSKYEEVGFCLALQYPHLDNDKLYNDICHEFNGIKYYEECPLITWGKYEIIGNVFSQQ